MDFTNVKNNNKVNINTIGLQLYNADSSFSPSTISLSLWNKAVVIAINPAKPENERTNTSVYDYEKKTQVVLDCESMITLANIIDKDILPSIGKDDVDNVNKGITVGKDSAITVNVKNTEEKSMVYIAIYKGIDSSYNAKDKAYFVFKDTTILSNYNGTSDDNENMKIDSQYSSVELFSAILRNYAESLANGVRHTMRLDNAYKSKSHSNQYIDKPDWAKKDNRKDDAPKPVQQVSSLDEMEDFIS